MTNATPFPNCAHDCEIIKILGCCECEACCPHKFDKDGHSLTKEQILNKDGFK